MTTTTNNDFGNASAEPALEINTEIEFQQIATQAVSRMSQIVSLLDANARELIRPLGNDMPQQRYTALVNLFRQVLEVSSGESDVHLQIALTLYMLNDHIKKMSKVFGYELPGEMMCDGEEGPF